jgi:ligand-binding SRPBCC domain-containing protein
MPIYTLGREQFVPRPLEEVFAFFSDASNLEKITPRWLNFRILTRESTGMRRGTLLDYRLKWHGLPVKWRTEIINWNPPHSFTDLQLRGPYKLWHHTHTFNAEPSGTRMVDVVRYELPLGIFGSLAHRLGVRGDLQQVFDYRGKIIAELFPATTLERF